MKNIKNWIQVTRDDNEIGSFTAELVVLVPIIMAFALMLVTFARIERARSVVLDSARAGAETASILSSPQSAVFGATEASSYIIMRHNVTCTNSSSVAVDVSSFEPGGWVSVTVVCNVRLSDVSFPGVPGSITFSSTELTPVDPYVSIHG